MKKILIISLVFFCLGCSQAKFPLPMEGSPDKTKKDGMELKDGDSKVKWNSNVGKYPLPSP